MAPASNCASLVGLSRLLRARNGQSLTQIYSRVPLKGPKTNTWSGQLQTTSEQDPTNFTNITSRGRLQQTWNSAKENYFNFFCFFLSYFFSPFPALFSFSFLFSFLFFSFGFLFLLFLILFCFTIYIFISIYLHFIFIIFIHHILFIFYYYHSLSTCRTALCHDQGWALHSTSLRENLTNKQAKNNKTQL